MITFQASDSMSSSDSNQNDIITRIENEISRLATEVRNTDNFGEENIVNVHGLVCLMRYAVWAEEEKFKHWLLSRGMTYNKGVMERIYLHKDIEGKDGVELRIHIFSEGSETFKHNHGQNFITMCIQGEYKHTYYTIVEDENSTYQKFIRTPGKGSLTPKGGEILPGRIVRARLDSGKLIPDENAQLVAFSEGDLPMFVPCTYHHTVHHDKEAHPVVITFVVRRGRRDNHSTTVIQQEGDRNAEDDQEPTDEPMEDDQKLSIYEKLKSALLRRGHSNIDYSDESEVPLNDDLKHYMTKAKHLAKFKSSDIDSDYKKQLIARFLKSNNFTSTPLMDGKKCVSVLRRPVSKEQENILQEREPPSVKISEHILGAVLWNVASKDLVVPIVDDNDEMLGIFSITDLVNSNEEFDRALIYSIAKYQREDDGEKIARKFLQRLRDLSNSAFPGNGELCSKDRLDHLTNRLMSQLGPLIVISPEFNQGRFKNISDSTNVSDSWIHSSANFPMFKLDIGSFGMDQLDEANDLLEMIKSGSDMDQILLDDGEKIQLMATGRGCLPLSITDKDITMLEAINRIRQSNHGDSYIPLIVQNDEGQYGILTKDDFNNEHAIKELSKLVSNEDIDDDLKNEIINHIIRYSIGEDSTLGI